MTRADNPSAARTEGSCPCRHRVRPVEKVLVLAGLKVRKECRPDGDP